MSISVTTDVHCDWCAQWDHGPTEDKQNTRRARRMVKHRGWGRFYDPFLKQMVDVCPNCLQSERMHEVRKA